MTERYVHITNVNNSPAMCFDTGLDPRSFARTKMSQSLIEQGYVVKPDGSHTVWKLSGVMEVYNKMRVWGVNPVANGKRLDEILNASEKDKQTALEAAVRWIRAKMFLGDNRSASNPGACFIGAGDGFKGDVFFAPEHLSDRCLYLEGSQVDTYNCPDLAGMDIAAFCAGVMLYKIFIGAHPYPCRDIFQDMREGVFTPLHLAAPELDKKLSALINAALLLPVVKKRTPKNGTQILTELLEMLMGKDGAVASASSFYNEAEKEKKEQAEKEKKRYLFKRNAVVKVRRFAAQNKHFLIGCGLGLFFVLFIVFSTVRGAKLRPTTEGMAPDTVVYAYFEGFSTLNHTLMEACVSGADRSDINAAATLFAIVRTRQAYDPSGGHAFIQARVWRDNGGELPHPNVFGVTDLTVVQVGGHEDEGLMVFRADYLLWVPEESHARDRSDILTLQRDRRKRWRIIEIMRTER